MFNNKYKKYIIDFNLIINGEYFFLKSSQISNMNGKVYFGNEINLKNGNTVNVCKYSDLDESTKNIALKIIGEINETICTDGIRNWNQCGYTNQLCERIATCLNAKNTLFVAFDGEQVIGYVAFYTRQDKLSYANKFLKSDQEAYCSWTGVDNAYRGQGLAEHLKLQIFESEHQIQTFRGHIKKTNAASIRVLDKFTEKGYSTIKEKQGHQILYAVHKPSYE